MRVENFNKALHVRALEVMRQMHIHIEDGDGVLHALAFVFDNNGVTYAFNADFVNRYLASIGRALHIGDGTDFGRIHDGSRLNCSKSTKARYYKQYPTELLGQSFTYSRGNACGIQPAVGQQLCGITLLDIAIGQAQLQQFNGYAMLS